MATIEIYGNSNSSSLVINSKNSKIIIDASSNDDTLYDQTVYIRFQENITNDVKLAWQNFAQNINNTYTDVSATWTQTDTNLATWSIKNSTQETLKDIQLNISSLSGGSNTIAINPYIYYRVDLDSSAENLEEYLTAPGTFPSWDELEKDRQDQLIETGAASGFSASLIPTIWNSMTGLSFLQLMNNGQTPEIYLNGAVWTP